MKFDEMQSFLKSRKAILELRMRRSSRGPEYGEWYAEAKVFRYQSCPGGRMELAHIATGKHADSEKAVQEAFAKADLVLGNGVAAVVAQRDAARAELEEMREAAKDLVDTLVSSNGGRQCSVCFSLATVAVPAPYGGSYFRCDKHAEGRSAQDEGEEGSQKASSTRAAAPLRHLQTLIDKPNGGTT